MAQARPGAWTTRPRHEPGTAYKYNARWIEGGAMNGFVKRLLASANAT
jgi:hypothetical protein